jgi:hypothetical protein
MVLEIQTARTQFATQGWLRLPFAEDVAAWARAAHLAARAAVAAPENANWLQCEGTWFVGVDALPNDATGQVGGAAFPATLRQWLDALDLPDLPLHPAQVSVTYPGYPRPRAGESEAAARYRRVRDAAHVDGLLPVGETRQRMLREPHAYILGLPLTQVAPEASPLVVWDGSHEVMRRALGAALGRAPSEDVAQVDLTEAYHAARREAFENCPRVLLPARPGEATLLHRLALHGVAPWPEGVASGEDGRMIAYFRPEGRPDAWISRP